MYKRILVTSLFFIGQLALARNTIATARLDWFHSNGHFHSLTGGSWVEQLGNIRYQFQERARNPDFVEIYDESRKISVRLYRDHTEEKFDDQLNYHRLYSGQWDTRRVFFTLQNPGGRPYFVQTQNNQFYYLPPGSNGPLFFDTVERTDDKIVLKGHGRTYWIFDNSVLYQDGPNGPTEFFVDGYWDETFQPR